MNNFLSREQLSLETDLAGEEARRFAGHLHRERQVGDHLKLDYSEAMIVVHDKLLQDVGGLPLGCFLIATRVEPGSTPNPALEDTSFLLLRVLGPLQLPDHSDTDRNRFEAAKRVADRSEQWDDRATLDQYTLNLLRYAGLRCRILGTFLLRQNTDGRWEEQFGPDLANFYSGRGMKVYKPDSALLATIVNYIAPQSELKAGGGYCILIGSLHQTSKPYASAARDRQGRTGESLCSENFSEPHLPRLSAVHREAAEMCTCSSRKDDTNRLCNESEPTELAHEVREYHGEYIV